MIARLVNCLVETQHADGGWGATPGQGSNVEATAFALLGLHTRQDPAVAVSISRGLAWLSAQQHSDGSWPLTPQLPGGSWVTALAILALAACASHRCQALRGAEWLLRHQGRRPGWLSSLLYRVAPQQMAVPLNPDIQGWPWALGTFSWVEPTAYALLALKKLRPALQGSRVDARIHQGELLLYDRMCAGGGWNYGNVRVHGVPLPPYPETTAVALIALQDHQAREANQISLEALRTLLMTHATSGLMLGWAMLCLVLYGEDVSAWRVVLTKQYEQTGFLNETKSLALALLALSDGAALLRVPPYARS